MRATQALANVATVLLTEPPQTRHWGYKLSKQSGVRAGVMYPMLRRMLDAKWLTAAWENPEETSGRPPRRYYQVTVRGRAALATVAELADP